MILGEKYHEPRCKICNRPDRQEIEDALESGQSGVQVARKFGITSANITSHRPHMSFSIPDKLRSIISKKIYKEDLDIESTNALIKLIQFYEGLEKESGTRAPSEPMDIGEAIRKALDELDDDTICPTIIAYDDFKDHLNFTNIYRNCDNCRFFIMKDKDYFNCHGRELGCGGHKIEEKQQQCQH